MKDNKITLLELETIIYFLARGLCIGISLSGIIEIAGVDAWISVLIGAIIGLIPFYIFNQLFLFEPNKNIIEKNTLLFKGFIGKLINIILILFCLSMLLVTLWNLTNFISSQYLYNTPQLFIAFVFTIPTIYLLSKSPKIIGRTIFVFFLMEIILYGLSSIGLFNQIEINNLCPILENGFIPILKGSLVYAAYNVLPIFIFTIFPRNNILKINSNKSLKKNLLITYALSNLGIFLIIFYSITIFGVELSKLYQYPLFQLLRRVEFGGFIQRAEATLSIHWIISLFVFCFLCFFFIKEGLKNIFKNEKMINKIYPIIVVIITYFSTLVFKNNTIANKFTYFIFNSFVGLFFFLIPLLIFIKAKNKR